MSSSPSLLSELEDLLREGTHAAFAGRHECCSATHFVSTDAASV